MSIKHGSRSNMNMSAFSFANSRKTVSVNNILCSRRILQGDCRALWKNSERFVDYKRRNGPTRFPFWTDFGRSFPIVTDPLLVLWNTIQWRRERHFHIIKMTCSGFMMTSSNGNIFRLTGHLCGEFTGPRWIPRTKASDAELWCFLWSASE